MQYNFENYSSIDDNRLADLGLGLLSGNELSKKKTQQRILSLDLQNYHFLKKIDECGRRYPCNSKHCTSCSNPQYSSYHRRLVNGHVFGSPTFQVHRYGCYQKPRSYREQQALSMSAPFHGLPVKDIHSTTIMLGITAGDVGLYEWLSYGRAVFKQLDSDLNQLGIHYYRLEVDMKYAGDIRYDFPDDELRPDIPEFAQNDLVAVAHLHGFSYIPDHSADEVREVLKTKFKGKNRVCVRTALGEELDKNGNIKKGLQGYAEYSCMNKTKPSELGLRKKQDTDDTIEFNKHGFEHIDEFFRARDAAKAVLILEELETCLKGKQRVIRIGTTRNSKRFQHPKRKPKRNCYYTNTSSSDVSLISPVVNDVINQGGVDDYDEIDDVTNLVVVDDHHVNDTGSHCYVHIHYCNIPPICNSTAVDYPQTPYYHGKNLGLFAKQLGKPADLRPP